MFVCIWFLCIFLVTIYRTAATTWFLRRLLITARIGVINCCCHSIVKMQMRFDGLLGFPGGLIDQGEEEVVSGLNRELEEEIGLDLTRFCIKDENHLVSFLHEKKNLVLHFYAKEVTMIEFQEIELKSLSAPDFGSEVMGVLRPPLFTMGDGKRGLPAFLTNSFAGNAREELVYAIRHFKLLTDEDLEESLKKFEELMKSNNSLK
ncbi:hypothetical protein CHS0354_039329 [Potamilus streckersoni]|uniref:U8 snoRNA-decapping enzyme n=1 Tax=Potamilus streckersoni TaxID=2493646 RepID=A0AAE0T3P1_9BIVA|nr:hypothetical protein CHS0354_039329 [Potamilus streckersoni]